MAYNVDVKELRKAMIDAKITTITGLADAAGVDRNTISAVLNGKAKPSAPVIEKISNALFLSGEDIGRIFFNQNLAYNARLDINQKG